MISNCMFCKFQFIRARDVVKSDKVKEGHMISTIECHNCGAKFKVIVTIESGPSVKDFATNQST